MTLRRLPSPRTAGTLSLEEAMARRRSVRELAGPPLTDAEIAQLLWAANGVTDDTGRRTVPAPGGIRGIDVYAVTPDGVLHDDDGNGIVSVVSPDDRRAALAAAAGGQACVAAAAVTLAIVSVPARVEARYGARTIRYVTLEAGHAAQNVLLEAVSLGLASVPVGSFDDDAVAGVLGVPRGQIPLYLLPIGHAPA